MLAEHLKVDDGRRGLMLSCSLLPWYQDNAMPREQVTHHWLDAVAPPPPGHPAAEREGVDTRRSS
jgi:hypothetical protein